MKWTASQRVNIEDRREEGARAARIRAVTERLRELPDLPSAAFPLLDAIDADAFAVPIEQGSGYASD